MTRLIKIRFIYHDKIEFKQLNLEELDQIQIQQFFDEQIRPTFQLDKPNSEYLLFTFHPQEVNEQKMILLHLRNFQNVSILEKDDYTDVDNYCKTILPSLLCYASRTTKAGIEIARIINIAREIYIKANYNENVAYMLSLLPNDIFSKKGTELIQSMLQWFNSKYQSMPILCHYCQEPVSKPRKTNITLSERNRGAIYTHLFKCRNCGACTRKPNFLNAKEIDHQNFTSPNDCVFLFLSLFKAVGVESRIVAIPPSLFFLEFWSDAQKKFVHFDSFQCCYDCPLIYERAWKINVPYAVAIDEFTCTDVTLKYSTSGLKINPKLFAKIVKIKNLMFLSFLSEQKKKEIAQKIRSDDESMGEYAHDSKISDFEKEARKKSVFI